MKHRIDLTEEHKVFRDAVGKFCEREIVPYAEEWELWSSGGYGACLLLANLLALLGEKDEALLAIEKVQATIPGFRLEQGIAQMARGQATDTARERLTAGLKLMLEKEHSTD